MRKIRRLGRKKQRDDDDSNFNSDILAPLAPGQHARRASNTDQDWTRTSGLRDCPGEQELQLGAGEQEQRVRVCMRSLTAHSHTHAPARRWSTT